MPTYVDIGISAILLLAIIIGVIKGFAKQFTGGFCGLVGLIGSIGLTLIIMPALINAGALNGLSDSAAGWFTGAEFTAPISSQDELIATLSSSGFLRILTAESISGRIWATMSQSQMSTLGAYFGSICIKLIVGFVLWIILLLIIKLIFFGIKKALIKLSTLPVLHTLDRIFGAIWSLLIAYAIIVVFIMTAVEIVAIKWLPTEIQESLKTIVNNSAVYQVLHDTNVIGAYIAQLFNVDLAAMSPII